MKGGRATLERRRLLKITYLGGGKRFVGIAAGLWHSRFEVLEETDTDITLRDTFGPGRVTITVAKKPIEIS